MYQVKDPDRLQPNSNTWQKYPENDKNEGKIFKSDIGGGPAGDNDDLPRKKKNIGLRSEDFSLKLGKVIDTLNSDYPLIFVKPLDYSIYIDDIEVTDPTGIAFQGLNTYKNLFTILRFFAKTVFTG